METIIEKMKRGELQVDSLVDYWEFLTPEQKKEIPISWMMRVWKQSSPEVKKDVEKNIEKKTGKEFRAYLIVLKNSEKNSKDFFAILRWIKRNFNDLVKKVYLDNFLKRNMSFGQSF